MPHDLRYALRMLVKHPGFSAIAVLTLAVGVGANAALFTVAETLLLRTPAEVAAPNRLVALGRTSSTEIWRGFGHLQFKRYREAARSFSGLAASERATILLHTQTPAVRLRVNLVTGDYFGVLSVPITRGRAFLAEEDAAPGAAPVTVLSDALWRSRFGADPLVVGKNIRLGRTVFTVVGIAPPGFRGTRADDPTDLWMPLAMEGATSELFPVLNSDFFSSLSVVGRLAPGVTPAQAQAELDVLAARIEQPQGPRGETVRVSLSPNIAYPNPSDRAFVFFYIVPLFGAALMVLLVVCANLGGMLLARAESRRREIAVRLALGAGRGRLVRQLLGESLVLVLPAAIGGLLVSRWVTALIVATAAPGMVFAVNGRVLAFTLLVAGGSTLLFGLMPALQAATSSVVSDLKEARSSGSRRSLLRATLVSVQVGVTLVLCTGTGLMVRTLQKAAGADLGFDVSRLFVASPNLFDAGYDDREAIAFYPRAAGSLASLAGVQAVSWATVDPVGPGFFYGPWKIVIDDGGSPGEHERILVDHSEIGPRYFEVLGLRPIHGRVLEAADDSGAPLVAVINDAMARRGWKGVDPVGSRLRFELFMDWTPPIEIVGVVPDVRMGSLSETVRPQVYLPMAQYVRRKQHVERNATILLRVRPGFGERGGDTVARVVQSLDPDLPPVVATTAARGRWARLSDQRLTAELIGLFGGLALLLAALGVYGVLAFDVAARTREVGIRMALGAVHRDVLRLVLRRGYLMAGVGVALGLIGSAALTRVIASQLYGVTPYDPVSFGVAVLVIGSAVLLASWLPARRATRVDPATALRAE